MSQGTRDTTAEAADPFVDYYVRASVSPSMLERLRGTLEAVLRVRAAAGLRTTSLDVADVGCNTGSQSLLWAERGHNVQGLDINEELLKVAAARCQQAGRAARFVLGNATALPWQTGSIDVCLLPELLEHVADWEQCLSEAARVLRVGGTLFLSTTNALCPKQEEFALPMYSWYPRRLKKYYERLSVTTRPELVNYAKYPAIHWFTQTGLAAHLRRRGFETFDRFDFMDTALKSPVERLVVGTLRSVPPLRWLGYALTPYTAIIANKIS
jgi:2-polyprenyl-6-hydroxyphenyl methylase/3-demethylubiquinone-9 3-methyltransferase